MVMLRNNLHNNFSCMIAMLAVEMHCANTSGSSTLYLEKNQNTSCSMSNSKDLPRNDNIDKLLLTESQLY